MLEPEAKERLRAAREQLDPFALAEAVEKHLRQITRLRKQIAAARLREEEEGDPYALGVGVAASASESLRSSCAAAAAPTPKASSFRGLTHPKKQTKTKPNPVSHHLAQPLAA